MGTVLLVTNFVTKRTVPMAVLYVIILYIRTL